MKTLKEGEPCGHPGCLNHVTHPREGCGRTAGRLVTPELKQSDLQVGTKVRYQPAHYGEEHWENGKVKEIPTHTTKAVRVVYNCNNEWGRYQDYTSAITRLTDLKLGWR